MSEARDEKQPRPNGGARKQAFPTDREQTDGDRDTRVSVGRAMRKPTPQRDLYFMSAVIAAGFTAVSSTLAVMWADSVLAYPFAFLPTVVFLWASRDYFGAAFPPLEKLHSEEGDSGGER